MQATMNSFDKFKADIENYLKETNLMQVQELAKSTEKQILGKIASEFVKYFGTECQNSLKELKPELKVKHLYFISFAF